MFGLEIIALELLGPLVVAGAIAGYKKCFGESEPKKDLDLETIVGYMESATKK